MWFKQGATSDFRGWPFIIWGLLSPQKQRHYDFVRGIAIGGGYLASSGVKLCRNG
jgi:hypothetical protein